MTSKTCMTTMVLGSVVLATPVFAQISVQTYNAAVSFSCVAEDSTDTKETLFTIKGNNREIIALCNNLDPSDPANRSAISDLQKEQVVVAEEGSLLVINRCTGQTICGLALGDEGAFCKTASNETQNGGTQQGICILEPGDLMAGDSTIMGFNGSLRCKLQGSQKGENSSTQFGCHGYPAISIDMFEDTFPCTMNISTGGLFKAPNNCPSVD